MDGVQAGLEPYSIAEQLANGQSDLGGLSRSEMGRTDRIDSPYATSESDENEEVMEDTDHQTRAVSSGSPSNPVELRTAPGASDREDVNHPNGPARKKRKSIGGDPLNHTRRKDLDARGDALTVSELESDITEDIPNIAEMEEGQAVHFGTNKRAESTKMPMMSLNDRNAGESLETGSVVEVVEGSNETIKLNRPGQTGSTDDISESTTDKDKPAASNSHSNVAAGKAGHGDGNSTSKKRAGKAKKPYEPLPMSESTKEAIKERLRAHVPPRYLYRASSRFRVPGGCDHKTNGEDFLTVHRPAADVNDKGEECHQSFYDIPNDEGQLSEMLGERLMWERKRDDEMLSWSSSLLFALVHATGRLVKDQSHIVIHVIDSTKVTTTDGNPVEFHFAPDLIKLFSLREWPAWHAGDTAASENEWFSHEWLTHGVVHSPETQSWEANIEDLLAQGLYDFLPHLRTPKEIDMRALYGRCGYMRSIYHRLDAATTPVTWDQFTMAKRLSRCFVDKATRSDPYIMPPLHLVIGFLGIEPRPKRDASFIFWIQSSYTVADLTAIDYARSVRVANNLPEVAQTLDLARAATSAFGAAALPATQIWTAHGSFDHSCKWLEARPMEIKIRRKKQKSRKKISAKKLC